jgi:hypothetical protein
MGSTKMRRYFKQINEKNARKRRRDDLALWRDIMSRNWLRGRAIDERQKNLPPIPPPISSSAQLSGFCESANC